MAQVRYAVVFGKKDTADRFLPIGEIYLRNKNLEDAKSLFRELPKPGKDGDFVVRIYERYYDKHIEPDFDYQKTEFTLECDLASLDKNIHFLIEHP